MRPLSVFRTRIAPRVPGASDMLIDQAVLDTSIDFCERSLVVKRMLDSYLTVAGQIEYDLDGATEQIVAKIMRVWCDDCELTPIDEDGVASPSRLTQSTPRFFSESEPGVLAFHPVPDKAYTINTRVALRPTRSATQVEDALFEDWADGIVNGALSRLHTMSEPFANPMLAQGHGKAYLASVNEAMQQARRGSTRAQSRITPIHI